jgi:hypothetical protein
LSASNRGFDLAQRCRLKFWPHAVLARDRRRLRHFNITAYPTSVWTAQQMVEAFPWDKAFCYLLHDRDSVNEGAFRHRVRYDN